MLARTELRTQLMVFLACLALAMNAVAEKASGGNPAWEVPGKWRPWSMEGYSANLLTCASRAEWGALETNMKRIRAVWEAMPLIASPIGYEIAAGGSYPVESPCERIIYPKERKKGERPYLKRIDKSVALSGEVSFYPFNHAAIRPRLTVDDETHGIWFAINRVPLSSLPLLRDVFIEPYRVAERFGLPAYEISSDQCSFGGRCGTDDLLIIKNNENALWEPVALLEVYEQLLDEVSLKIETFEIERDKRQRDFDELVSAKQRKSREDNCRRDSTEKWQHKAPRAYLAECVGNYENEVARTRNDIAEANPRSNISWGNWKQAADFIAERRKRIMSGDARSTAYLCARPELVDGNDDSKVAEYAAQFTAIAGKTCRQIVRASPHYFNPRLPRTAMQLITVGHYRPCLNGGGVMPGAPGQCNADLKLLKHIDWNSIRSLMDR